MAQITFTIADGDVTRIIEAFEYRYGEKPPEEAAGKFVKRHMIEMIQNWVNGVNGDIVRSDEIKNFSKLDIT